MWRLRVKTIGRVAALVWLLMAFIGPWTFDSHPSTEAECPAPGVWLGDGRCSCLQSPVQLLVSAVSGGGGLASIVLLFALLLLPFVTTLLILVVGERRWLRVSHLAAWALLGALSTLMFVLHWSARGPVSLRLWPIWLCAVVATALLIGEIPVARSAIGSEAEA